MLALVMLVIDAVIQAAIQAKIEAAIEAVIKAVIKAAIQVVIEAMSIPPEPRHLQLSLLCPLHSAPPFDGLFVQPLDCCYWHPRPPALLHPLYWVLGDRWTLLNIYCCVWYRCCVCCRCWRR